ncbi:hypothetical protein BDN70DRAFT_879960 [Pholiota conissans]|uniref:Uncharacterized protein n=1 Tax=Pholiota conissans TaxID=109636 RepID=A0A9P5YZH3_9AGAR|nr:hypothetical protein BDN70DRAFT_879960 [Pholiota conissans]
MRPPSKVIPKDSFYPPRNIDHDMPSSSLIPTNSMPIANRIIRTSRPHHHVPGGNTHKNHHALPLKLAWMVVTMGRLRSVFQGHKYVGRSSRDNFDIPERNPDLASFSMAQWELVLRVFRTEWKTSRFGCVIVVPLAITILQIDTVSEDIYARTAAIMSFLFSATGLVLSVSLLSIEPKFHARNSRNKWIQSSRTLEDLESTEFWSLFILPASLLIWSIIPNVIAVLILTWNGGGIVGSGTASAIVLMSLTTVLAGLMYRCKQTIRKLLTQPCLSS